MDSINRYLTSIGFLALLLTGCTPVRQQAYRNSFLPPTVAKPSPEAPPDPPVLDSRLELRDSSPQLHFLLAAPSPGRGSFLIQEAEARYQAGRKLYQEGDRDGARREFDQAVDTLLVGPGEAAAVTEIDKKLDELVGEIHRLDLAGLGAGDTGEPGFEKPPLEDMPPMTFLVDPKLKNRVLEEVRATVSQLPLEVNDAVLSYIRYFSSERGKRIVMAGLRRAGRYRPLVQRVLDEEGVPQELIYLAQAESGFLPRAVSRKKATGMWQFVQFRGREYGLNQTAYSDDRLDPEKATRAAARHLRDLYHHFGDWYLAMAAYNCGPVTVDRAVERTGYPDFWELKRRSVLPKETANYVPIILAITIMAKNAAGYGLDNIDPDPALDYDTLEIFAPTNLPLLADLSECPVSQLRDLNPALLKSVAPGGYLLHVPRGTAAALRARLEAVPAENRASWRVHRAAAGDDLASIAKRYLLAPSVIAAANHELNGELASGDLVLIPTKLQEESAAARKPRVTARRTVAARTGARTPASSSHRVARRPSGTARGVAYASNAAPLKGRTVKR